MKTLKGSNPTVWSLAYAPLTGKAYFRTTLLPEIRSIDLKALNFSCKEEAWMLNMEDNFSGDVTSRFSKFSAAKNSEMIRESLPGFLKGFLASKIEKYPDSVACLE